MRLAVRLYPAAWRERYGEEMERLLLDRPPGPRATLDLAMGALDAHLHGLGRSAGQDAGWASLPIGAGAITAGALWVVGIVGALGMVDVASAAELPIIGVAVSLFVATLLAVPVADAGVLGRLARLVAGSGVALMGFGLAGMWLADLEVAYLPWIVGLAAAILGAAALAATTLVGRRPGSRPMGVLLLGASAQAIPVFLLQHTEPWPIVAGAVLFGGAWVWVGVRIACAPSMAPGDQRGGA